MENMKGFEILGFSLVVKAKIVLNSCYDRISGATFGVLSEFMH